jgi:thiamine-phosphate pyrophosphorylase
MPALRGLYAVTDPDLIGEGGLARAVEAALGAGVRLLQYRNKTGSAPQRAREAALCASLCARHDARLIINDDLDLAVSSGAAGVHLGEDDAALSQARARLGEDAVIGISCYDSLERAREAERDGADYVAFGAVFPSATKPAARRADLDLIRRARAELRLPICAIGGIDPTRAAEVYAAGADMLAVVSGIFGAGDIGAACAAFPVPPGRAEPDGPRR